MTEYVFGGSVAESANKTQWVELCAGRGIVLYQCKVVIGRFNPSVDHVFRELKERAYQGRSNPDTRPTHT